MNQESKATSPILVFGSNLAGRHGAGAAYYAKRHHGAITGLGEGLAGTSYALPTKDHYLRTLPLHVVRGHIDKFLAFAKAHPQMTFKVTRIGCGLAGYTDAEIAPLFKDAFSNCEFDTAWEEWLPFKFFWGTY